MTKWKEKEKKIFKIKVVEVIQIDFPQLENETKRIENNKKSILPSFNLRYLLFHSFIHLFNYNSALICFLFCFVLLCDIEIVIKLFTMLLISFKQERKWKLINIQFFFIYDFAH